MEENLNDKTRQKVWEFGSNSSSKTYHTILYTDGFISCNCRGWTMKKKGAVERYCRHKDMVEMGTADSNCISCKDQFAGATPVKVVQTAAPKTTAPPKKKKASIKKTKADEAAPAIARKIYW